MMSSSKKTTEESSEVKLILKGKNSRGNEYAKLNKSQTWPVKTNSYIHFKVNI